MPDHLGFDSQGTAVFQKQFVIRFTVFSCENDLPFPHGLPGSFDVPAILTGSGKTNGIKTIQRVKQAHGGSDGVASKHRKQNTDDVKFLLGHNYQEHNEFQ